MNTRNEIYRIIDANINRASEALRTLEEWARFSKNNVEISTKLKTIRHKLNQINIERPNLILNRESTYDIGKDIENISSKKTIRDIIRSSAKRLEESLRVINEYGSIIGIECIDHLRFDIYSIEKQLIMEERLLRLNNSKLYLVTDRTNFQDHKSFLKTIESAIEGGVDIVQLREKNATEKEIITLSKEIKKIIQSSEVLFIVNDRVDLALICEADGVHVGQDDIPISEVKKIVPAGFIIGLSTHCIEQGKIGNVSGADYLGVGPVYKTPTKPDYTPAGLEYVKWAKDNINIPWFAIGGINSNNIEEVTSYGANRVAVVRDIINSSSPKESAQKIKNALKQECINV